MTKVVEHGDNGWQKLESEPVIAWVPKMIPVRGLRRLWNKLLGRPMAYPHPTSKVRREYVASVWAKAADPKRPVRLRIDVNPFNGGMEARIEMEPKTDNLLWMPQVTSAPPSDPQSRDVVAFSQSVARAPVMQLEEGREASAFVPTAGALAAYG